MNDPTLRWCSTESLALRLENSRYQAGQEVLGAVRFGDYDPTWLLRARQKIATFTHELAQRATENAHVNI